MAAKPKQYLDRFVSRIPGLFPKRVRDALRGTWADDLYQRVWFRTAPTEVRTYQNEMGELTFLVPSATADNFVNLEPGLTSECAQVLSEDDVFYDIGANIGYFSKFVETYGLAPENIYAFEANLYYYLFLKENCSEGINLHHKRLGASSEDDELALDDFVDEVNSPDVVKIDVDGFEFEILRGMDEILSTRKPMMYVEMHPGLLVNGIPETRVFEYMREHGYSLDFINHKKAGGDWTSDDSAIPYATSYETPQYLMRARN